MVHTPVRPVAAFAALLGLSLVLGGVARAAPQPAPNDGPPAAVVASMQDDGPTQPLSHGALRIQSHDVAVMITNGFATTTVDQVLVNPSAHAVEAAWAFPLPKDAAMSELSLHAGGKEYMGEVVEKQRAREVYATEKAAGKTTALAEQHEYFHYQVKIARVPAGGEVKARVVYVQALAIESGVGRYLYPMQEGNTDDLDNAFWSMERKATGRLSFDVTLKTSFPVDRLASPSHPTMAFKQPTEGGVWHARFEAASASLDRDFTLLYRLHPDVPARIELLTQRNEGAAEGTFMAVVTPGSDLAPIQGGTDWAFVLDVSGSMEGEKIRTLKNGVGRAVAALGPKDRFQVFTFNNAAHQMTRRWLTTDAQGTATGKRIVNSIQAGGGTDVFAGLSAAYRVLDADRPTGIILVSDGVANVGPHHYRDLISLSKKHDVRMFTFAIGNSANERLLGDMAKMSGGTSASISVVDQMAAQLLLARERMTHTAIHGLTFDLPGATVIYPKTMPTLFMGQQLVVVGRYGTSGPAQLEVSAKISGEDKVWTVPVDLPPVDASNPELERLYALAAITDMERESWLRTGNEGEARSAIVDMALRYSLVTDYTSMIVMEQERKVHYGIGNANAERRNREKAAATRRSTSAPSVRVSRGATPIAGNQAAHAPSRHAARTRSGGGGGGSGGSGALGPWALLAAAGLAFGSRRRSS